MTDRKAKVTDEHRHEATQLAALWDSRAHPSQAEFGEQYEVGSQSAVGQFLRGDTPLSLKAAAGFAVGLGCKIADFSPRLAKQALAYADLSGISHEITDLTRLTRSEAQVVLALRQLGAESQDEVLRLISQLLEPGKKSQRKQSLPDPSYALPQRKKNATKVHA